MAGDLDMNSSNEAGAGREKTGLVGCGNVALDAEVAVVVVATLGTSARRRGEGSIVSERVELADSDTDLGAGCAIVSDREGSDPESVGHLSRRNKREGVREDDFRWNRDPRDAWDWDGVDGDLTSLDASGSGVVRSNLFSG